MGNPGYLIGGSELSATAISKKDEAALLSLYWRLGWISSESLRYAVSFRRNYGVHRS